MDVVRVVPAAPAAAWRLFTDLDTWPRWGPTVTAAERTDGQGARRLSAGARGRVRTPAGVWLPFVVTAFDPGHRWAWRVAGVPATGHRVEPHPGGTRVVFEVPVLAAPYALVCRVALARIAELLVEESGPCDR